MIACCLESLTRQFMGSILSVMNENDSNNRVDLDLKKLEVRVEELIRACALLKDENSSLRSQQESLTAERAVLIEKTELARTRVEAMIARLKAMETG